jgi:CheY-like chemotaxis protein
MVLSICWACRHARFELRAAPRFGWYCASLAARKSHIVPCRLKILYVEDDQDAVWLFDHVLRRVKPTLRFAQDGQEAVDYLEGRGNYADRSKFPLPDIIFTDWRLPRIEGRVFLQWCKKTAPFDAVPIVVLTGSGFETEIKEAKALGAHLALAKPSDVQALHNTLMGILQAEVVRRYPALGATHPARDIGE